VARTMNYFAYTRNDGSTLNCIRVATDIAAATGLGFGDASAAHPAPPIGFRPRGVYLLDPATGRKRREPVATPAAYATLTGPGEHTIDLEELGSGTATTWTVTGGREEHVPVVHLIHS
jgi:hypothetical protein